MLLFNNITWYSLVAWFVVLGAIILINEFARKSKVFSVILCVVMPIVLTVFVCPHTAGEGSSTGTWFQFIKKGVWIQNRAYTLAAWMMFTMAFPSFVDTSIFAVQSSHNAKALLIVSIISLLSNIIVFIYHFYKIFKYKRNPFKEDVHFDLKAFSATLFEATINNSI